MPKLGLAAAVLAGSILGACTASSTAPTPAPTPAVASPGEMLILDCSDEAGCADGFVIRDQYYLLVCAGVEAAAIEEETLASGEGMFVETRTITGIPSELWLAVRGEIPCRPLDHDWYLAISGEGIGPGDLEEWGDAVGEVTIP